MTWLTPSLLWFALLGAVPILLHFLLRERVQKVAFSAMRFLRKQSREVLSRKKWLEWLLTILRVACIMLLVAAFARPFFASGIDAAGKFGSDTYILLDTSRSMTFGTRFADAQAQAEQLAKAAAGDSRITVVTFGGAEQIHFSEPGDATAAVDAIHHAAATAGSTDVFAAIDKVLETVKQHNGSGEVHLISDLQASGLPRNRDVRKLPPSYKFVVHAIAGKLPEAGGVAIEGGAFSADVTPGEQNFSVAARVHNRGPAREVEAQLKIAGKSIATKRIQLAANGETALTLGGTLRDVGEHPGQVVITGAPVILPGDDAYNFIVRVVKKVKVVVVNGHPSKNEKDDAAYYILAALNAGDDSPYSAKAYETLPDLKDVNVVILSALSTLPPADVKRLEEFVKSGGGMMISAGPGVNAASFDASIGTISPAKLRAWTAGDDLFLMPANAHHSLVTRIVSEGGGDLTAGRFNGYWDLKDSQEADVVLRFSNNRPALLQGHLGNGTTIFFPAAMDMRAGDFPLHGIFVPFIREAVRILQDHGTKAASVLAGESYQLGADGSIEGPDGKIQRSEKSAVAVTLSAPGIYKVTQSNTTELLAVNGDVKESDLTPASASDLEKMIASAPETEVRRTAEGFERVLSGDARVGAEHKQNIGWYCLLTVAALCLTELYVAQLASRK